MTKSPSSQAAKPKKPAAKTSTREVALKLLRRVQGASLADLTKATGWQPHSARAVISGLRKQGLAIARTRDGKASVYKLSEQP